MDDKLKKSYIWSFIYLIIEFIMIYIFKSFYHDAILYISILGIIYILINLFFIKYKKEHLFINGIISYVTVILLGVWTGGIFDVAEIICLAASVSIVDVVSFTKYGKNTPNAKLMSNGNTMYKLIVYGKGKEAILYPTLGIGDYYNFSFWISGLSNNTYMLILLCFAIWMGNLINNMITYKIHNKPTYKGLPATIIPFVCIVVCYLIGSTCIPNMY